MPIRVITIEREYGSGGALIAEQLAQRLGWKLWDAALTGEIARRAHVPVESARNCDEHVDPLLYRLFKVFARGSYERRLPVGGDNGEFDTDHMVGTLCAVVKDAASSGNCVIVGRGAPYILRERIDAFHVFVFAPIEEKVRRLRAMGKTEPEARDMIDTIDKERGQFIKRYFGAEWPHRPLYDLMINSELGDDYVMEMILHGVSLAEKLQAAKPATA
jgi:cytidylate kinase